MIYMMKIALLLNQSHSGRTALIKVSFLNIIQLSYQKTNSSISKLHIASHFNLISNPEAYLRWSERGYSPTTSSSLVHISGLHNCQPRVMLFSGLTLLLHSDVPKERGGTEHFLGCYSSCGFSFIRKHSVSLSFFL